MNEYWFQLIVNLALIVAIVFLVVNEHYWFAFLLCFGVKVVGKDLKGDKNDTR